MKRSRTRLALALATTIALGLATRNQGLGLPAFVTDHAGDALWTVAVYLGLCLLMPGARPLPLAGFAFLLSVTVELSQLVQTDWLQVIRSTRAGRLLLGTGFLWVDLVRYLAGAFGAYVIDSALRSRNRGAVGKGEPLP